MGRWNPGEEGKDTSEGDKGLRPPPFSPVLSPRLAWLPWDASSAYKALFFTSLRWARSGFSGLGGDCTQPACPLPPKLTAWTSALH